MSNFFDGFIDGSEDLINKLKFMINPVNSVNVTIDAFKKAAREWFDKYDSLLKIPNSQLSPELIMEKQSLIKRGGFIVDKIKLLGLTADTVKNSGLGIAPLLGGAVIITASSLMVYWTIDFIKFTERMTEYKSLRKSGKSHSEAKQIINDIESKDSIFDNLSGIAKNGAIGVGVIVAYKVGKDKGWF